ncbi:hypothetical protein AURDEDRAFT_114192 [Auricularia subglabra TFB-10046 SS5]|nr:hypothetical protein AURDEDRAFT_114192 [Auricularia subglabra TFB-10046 SS5]
MVLAQTLAKLDINTTGRKSVSVPTPSSMGIALGLTPRELCISHDGLLGHGRQFGGRTAFSDKSLWTSKSLVQIMREANMITEDVFTIFIDHPKLSQSMPSCIIYGTPYENEHPPIPSDNWTTLPVYAPPGQPGQWKLRLQEIVLHAKMDDAPKAYPFAVKRTVLVDSGTASTYLPVKTDEEIRQGLGRLFELRNDGTLFHDDDDVELIFDPKGTGRDTISITGQAKRFFQSPYADQKGTACACTGTRGDVFVLGLNFFMTFILSFQDASMDAEICARPHAYV